MSEKAIENNKVTVIGKIVSGFTFSHEVFGEGFYVVDLEVSRLSEQSDIIPLMISERLLNVEIIWDTVVDSINGTDKVSSLSLSNKKTGEKKEISVDWR